MYALMQQKRVTAWFLLTCLVCLPAPVISQIDKPSVSEGALRFYLDHTVFDNQESGQVYCEFYLMWFAGQINGIILDPGLEGQIAIEVSTFNEITGVSTKKNWITSVRLSPDSLKNATLAVYDVFAETLSAGLTRVTINLSDLNGSKSGSASHLVKISEPKSDQPRLSQIEFISRLEEGDQKSRFYKSGRNAYPNPMRQYGLLTP
ncbi:MAG: hypothetical protein E4H13_11775, partial [Calditrichales bacterium]